LSEPRAKKSLGGGGGGGGKFRDFWPAKTKDCEPVDIVWFPPQGQSGTAYEEWTSLTHPPDAGQDFLDAWLEKKGLFSYVLEDKSLPRLIKRYRLHQWLSSIQKMRIETSDGPYPKNITAITTFWSWRSPLPFLLPMSPRNPEIIWNRPAAVAKVNLIRPTRRFPRPSKKLKRRIRTKDQNALERVRGFKVTSACISRLAVESEVNQNSKRTVSKSFGIDILRTFIVISIKIWKKDFLLLGSRWSRYYVRKVFKIPFIDRRHLPNAFPMEIKKMPIHFFPTEYLMM